MYADISKTYKQNASLLSKLDSREELDAMLGKKHDTEPDSDVQSDSETETDNKDSDSDEHTAVIGRPESGDVSTNQAVNNRRFMVAYDVEKAAYTVVMVDDYLTDYEYKSENERVGVKNLATAIKGKADNATAIKDDQTEKGIWMYLLAVVMVAGGIAAFVPAMRKNSKNKRK